MDMLASAYVQAAGSSDGELCVCACVCPGVFIVPQVFRAAQLVVPDMRLTQDTLFSSISVTAEQWVPMLEVPEAALLPWLEKKQVSVQALILSRRLRASLHVGTGA